MFLEMFFLGLYVLFSKPVDTILQPIDKYEGRDTAVNIVRAK